MKRIFTLLLGLMIVASPAIAQDEEEVDKSFIFVDENGTEIPNEATVVRNVVEPYGDAEAIYSGISVKNVSAEANDFIRVYYFIEQIDNGTYQICFPITCNSHYEEGFYETSPGQFTGTKSLMSEWLPTADGTCIVTLAIEVVTQVTPFPPTYVPKAAGSVITVQFVKGGVTPEPVPGDVNNDGEVNVADINAVIDMILAESGESSGDVNKDGEVNIADVNAVIDMILNQ